MAKKQEPISTTIGEMLSGVTQEVESLADEMENWKESLPENLQESEKAERIDDAENTLRDAAEDNMVGDLDNIPVQHTPTKTRTRPDRRDEVCAQIQSVIDVLDEVVSNAEELKSELESKQGDLEGVEFPKMFG